MIRVTEEILDLYNEVILVHPSTILEIRPITEFSHYDRLLRQTNQDFRNDEGDYISAAKSVILRTGELDNLYVLETVDQIYEQLIQLRTYPI